MKNLIIICSLVLILLSCSPFFRSHDSSITGTIFIEKSNISLSDQSFQPIIVIPRYIYGIINKNKDNIKILFNYESGIEYKEYLTDYLFNNFDTLSFEIDWVEIQGYRGEDIIFEMVLRDFNYSILGDSINFETKVE